MGISSLCYSSRGVGEINDKLPNHQGLNDPRKSSNLTCYTDSLLKWSGQIGLSLQQHVSTPAPSQIHILRNLLVTPTPTSFTLCPATCLQQLTTIPSDLQTASGKGATGVTITYINIQIRIATPTETCVITLLFHDLLIISFALAILHPTSTVHIYSDSK